MPPPGLFFKHSALAGDAAWGSCGTLGGKVSPGKVGL